MSQILLKSVIKQIGLPLRGRPILLITRMITDRIGLHSVLLTLRIGRHEVLLPIIITLTKFVIYKALFLNQNTKNSKSFFFASSEKRPFKSARDGVYSPIT